MIFKRMGFTDSLENLDALKGELFIVIMDEMAKIEESKANKKGGK